MYPSEGSWFCRQCATERGGDALSLVAKLENLDLHTRAGMERALEILQLDGTQIQPRQAPTPPTPPRAESPDTAWQARALEIVEEAEQRLWSKEGAPALKYLREQRGLWDSVIKPARLGYIPGAPTDWRRPDGWHIQDGDEIKQVNVPCGITIPHFVGGELYNVRVRRAAVITDNTGRALNSKYQAITGGKRALYWMDQVERGKPLLIVEGELDALAAWQCIEDMASVVALVSASYYNIPSDWIHVLTGAPEIRIRMDKDSAGMRAISKLKALAARARVVEVPVGKDINDFMLATSFTRVMDWWTDCR